MKDNLRKIAALAKQASFKLNLVGSELKSSVLRQMAEALLKEKEAVITANKKDLSAAHRKKLSQAFVDRLTLIARGV